MIIALILSKRLREAQGEAMARGIDWPAIWPTWMRKLIIGYLENAAPTFHRGFHAIENIATALYHNTYYNDILFNVFIYPWR